MTTCATQCNDVQGLDRLGEGLEFGIWENSIPQYNLDGSLSTMTGGWHYIGFTRNVTTNKANTLNDSVCSSGGKYSIPGDTDRTHTVGIDYYALKNLAMRYRMEGGCSFEVTDQGALQSVTETLEECKLTCSNYDVATASYSQEYAFVLTNRDYSVTPWGNITAVVNATTATAYVLGVDYYFALEDDRVVIVLRDTAIYTSGDQLTVTYDYLPFDCITIVDGTKVLSPEITIRLRNIATSDLKVECQDKCWERIYTNMQLSSDFAANEKSCDDGSTIEAVSLEFTMAKSGTMTERTCNRIRF